MPSLKDFRTIRNFKLRLFGDVYGFKIPRAINISFRVIE